MGWFRGRIRFSIRTMLAVTLGYAILCGLFRGTGLNVNVIHALIVAAFAIPGASFGYDQGRTSRAAVIGMSVAAVAGTCALSAYILILDWMRYS